MHKHTNKRSYHHQHHILMHLFLNCKVPFKVLSMLQTQCRKQENHMTNSFSNGTSVSFRVLGAEGKALDSSGEIKLTHLLTQAAVGHVRLGGQVHWCFYGNHNISCETYNIRKKTSHLILRSRAFSFDTAQLGVETECAGVKVLTLCNKDGQIPKV